MRKDKKNVSHWGNRFAILHPVWLTLLVSLACVFLGKIAEPVSLDFALMLYLTAACVGLGMGGLIVCQGARLLEYEALRSTFQIKQIGSSKSLKADKYINLMGQLYSRTATFALLCTTLARGGSFAEEFEFLRTTLDRRPRLKWLRPWTKKAIVRGELVSWPWWKEVFTPLEIS